ncbi:MAG: protein kinase domain-containing protein [Myxococcota bacterium]
MSEMLQPGDVLDDSYEIIEFISKGGFGAVYRARQLSMDRDVALKLLISGAQPDFEGLVRRFRNEVKAVRNLRHPNTVQIYDFHETHDGQLYFTMEYLDGRSLRELLERGEAISPKRTANILAQSLKSLAEAHSTGIIHRDIKPANIMLVDMYGEDDFVKVLDFGIAKAIEDGGATGSDEPLTRTGYLVGTVRYMAPERIAGDPAGPYSDIYSLGLVGASLLAGRPLLGNSSRLEAMQLQMSAKPLPVPEQILTTALGPVLQRSLAKNPKHRYQSAEDMLEEMLAIPDTHLERAPLNITGELPLPDALGAASSGIEPTTVDSEIQSGPSRRAQAEPDAQRASSTPSRATGWGDQEAVRTPSGDARQRASSAPPLPGSGPGSPEAPGPEERTQVFESGSTRRPVTSEVMERSSDESSLPSSRPEPTPRPQGPSETASKRIKNDDASRSSRMPLLIGVAVVLIGLGAGLTWYLVQDGSPTEDASTNTGSAPSATDSYFVDLRSSPSGATVSEDGEELGVTPIQLEPAEGRRLVVELDGYQTRRIELGPEVPPSHTLELSPIEDGDSDSDDQEREDQGTRSLSFDSDEVAEEKTPPPGDTAQKADAPSESDRTREKSDPEEDPRSPDRSPETADPETTDSKDRAEEDEEQEVIPVFGSDDDSKAQDDPKPDKEEDIPVF